MAPGKLIGQSSADLYHFLWIKNFNRTLTEKETLQSSRHSS